MKSFALLVLLAFSAGGTICSPVVAETVSDSSRRSVEQRLDFWLRLVAPEQQTTDLTAQDYADFLAMRPVWPLNNLLQQRMQKKMLLDVDAATLAHLCQTETLTNVQTLVRCQGVLGASGHLKEEAARIWREGADTPASASLLEKYFGASLNSKDSWARFIRQERHGLVTAASRTLPFLAPEQQVLASAIIVFMENDAGAAEMFSGLSAEQQRNPDLLLAYLQWLRRAGRHDEAVDLWKNGGFQVEKESDDSKFFLKERLLLARELLVLARDKDACLLADDRSEAGKDNEEARILTGWIMLRRLDDPEGAENQFQKLIKSPSHIVRSHGLYWLGRARDALGDHAEAMSAWEKASLLPHTFYGQMSIAALDGDEGIFRDPSRLQARVHEKMQKIRGPVQENPDQESLIQAAEILVSRHDFKHARLFLFQMLFQVHDPAQRAAVAELALRLDMPDVAVMASRLTAKEDVVLPLHGWPLAWAPPSRDLPAGFARGLMRQESSFNPDAVSPSNAIGLMQLLPGTAREMGQKLHMGGISIALLHDPDTNMQLGTAYLSQVLKHFDGCVICAAAGYNAGPHRVDQWFGIYGDPREGDQDPVKMLDWIESVPREETRHYVQRVWENMMIYAPMENVRK